MEALFQYLVLTGTLSPGEGILVQHLLKDSLTKKKVRSLLNKSGFDYQDVISSMQTKKLVTINSKISMNWEGMIKMTRKVDEKIRGISHDLIKLKALGDPTNQSEKVQVGTPKIITRTPSKSLTPERLFHQFAGNQISRPESKVLEESNALQGVELIERLAQLDILKIVEKKQSRTIKLRSNGAALRYLFQNKTQLNSANLDFLEKRFLKPNGSSWENFLAILNDGKSPLPSWVIALLVLFIDLGVIVRPGEDQDYTLIKLSTPPLFEKEYLDKLEESISGFIPVYVKKLYEVVAYLSEDSNSKAIQDKLEMGPSSVSGILKMLSKFHLITKGIEKHHYQLTELGKKSMEQGEETFAKELRGILKQNSIFEETLKYAKGCDEPQFGFNDLVGYFRASGVPNFNPAKALAVLRLMTQTGYEIRKITEEGKSGFFELDEVNSQ